MKKENLGVKNTKINWLRVSWYWLEARLARKQSLSDSACRAFGGGFRIGISSNFYKNVENVKHWSFWKSKNSFTFCSLGNRPWPNNFSVFFRGTVSVDISLEDVDIDQCDAQDSAEQQSVEETGDKPKPNRLSTFMGTHRCKKSTKASYADRGKSTT